MSSWTIYWILMLDNIGTVSTIMAILVSIVGLGILGAARAILSEEGPGQ